MALLHVAAMPFPSVQGTQAAVRAMVDAEHADGRKPELIAYAHGGFDLQPPWKLHRIRDVVRDRSLRSGPSWRKVVQDAQLAVRAKRVVGKLRPEAVVAHHVEAAAAVLSARLSPVAFFAHTALGPELPTYLPEAARALASRAGDALDVLLAKRADVTLAISPHLATRLSEQTGRRVRFVPVPWTIPEPLTQEERRKARSRFGFGDLEPVFLYAGNLDAYQGLDSLVAAFRLVCAQRPDARLLVATCSEHEALEKALWGAECVDRATFAPLADEPDRRMAHAAADAAWVPRSAAGGLPMKLLDAMARGVPTVATRRATAGLDLAGAAMVASDDDPEAFAAAALLAVQAREGAADLGRRGTDWVRVAHSPDRYLAAMDEALRDVAR
ncbi:MAG: glycosyltransferase [Sandaracinaceae bacterium]